MFDIIKKNLKELNGAEIIIGVQGQEGENFHGQKLSSNEQMQIIAAVHEYGCDIKVTPKMRAWLHYNGIHLKTDTTVIHIPERSYIRRAKEEGQADMDTVISNQITRLLDGKTTSDEMLNIVGQQAVKGTAGNLGIRTTPVTDYTLENRKNTKSSTPLTDKGTLFNHITFRIQKGGA